EQALNVLLRAENRRAGGLRVAADPFEHRRAVVHHVRHHVDLCVVPGNELPVVPDLFRFRDRHAGSLSTPGRWAKPGRVPQIQMPGATERNRKIITERARELRIDPAAAIEYAGVT